MLTYAKGRNPKGKIKRALGKQIRRQRALLKDPTWLPHCNQIYWKRNRFNPPCNDLYDLKGNTYDLAINPEIDPEVASQEELEKIHELF